MVFALRVLIKFVVDVASNIDPIIGPLCRPLWNFIASLEVVTQLWAFESIFLIFFGPKAALNDQLFMQVMGAPVSNNQEVVLFPVGTSDLDSWHKDPKKIVAGG